MLTICRTKPWNHMKSQKEVSSSRLNGRKTARNTYAIDCNTGIGQYPQCITRRWCMAKLAKLAKLLKQSCPARHKLQRCCAFWLKLCKLFLVLDLTLHFEPSQVYEFSPFLWVNRCQPMSTDVNRLVIWVISLQRLDKGETWWNSNKDWQMASQQRLPLGYCIER
jgi:hypothetical protein